MDERIRCFIAIELSHEIKLSLVKIEGELKKTISGVKWVQPENIHLTLKFLGHVEAKIVDNVKEVLSEIAPAVKSFKIKLSQAGAFPSPAQARVIWVGIDEGKEETSHLARIIEEKLAPLGIEKESRAFHPHLTLARVKFLKDKSSVKNALTSLKVPQTDMTATKITLFQSTLTKEGSIYTVLHEVGLRK